MDGPRGKQGKPGNAGPAGMKGGKGAPGFAARPGLDGIKVSTIKMDEIDSKSFVDFY